MLKFILRVFVVAVISFAVAYQIVNRGLGYLVEPMVEDLAVRTMRGQVYALHRDLDPVAPPTAPPFCCSRSCPITAWAAAAGGRQVQPPRTNSARSTPPVS